MAHHPRERRVFTNSERFDKTAFDVNTEGVRDKATRKNGIITQVILGATVDDTKYMVAFKGEEGNIRECSHKEVEVMVEAYLDYVETHPDLEVNLSPMTAPILRSKVLEEDQSDDIVSTKPRKCHCHHRLRSCSLVNPTFSLDTLVRIVLYSGPRGVSWRLHQEEGCFFQGEECHLFGPRQKPGGCERCESCGRSFPESPFCRAFCRPQ